MSDLRRSIILDGDASGAVAAGNQAKAVLDQFGRQIESVQTKTKRQAEALAAQNREFEKLRMSYDKGYAQQKRYETAVKKITAAANAQKWSQDQLNAELQKAAIYYNQADAAAQNMNRTIRSARFHTANLSAQFFDVGVMMTSGQNPFIMGVQQGAQFSQVMQTMGGTLRQQFKALGAAFMSVVSPMTALSVGLIAGVGYLYQYMTAADEGAEKLSELEEAIKSLNQATRDAELDTAMKLGGYDSPEQYLLRERIIELRREEKALVEQVAEVEGNIATAMAYAEPYYKGKLEAAKEDLATKREELKANEEALAQNEAVTAGLEAIATLEKNIVEYYKEKVKEGAKLLADQQLLISSATSQASISREMRNQMEEYQRAMFKTFETSQALREELGEAAAQLLIMEGVDITSPISSAVKEAAALAATLGIALDAAISLQNLRASMEYSGRGGDPRDFGDVFTRDPNARTPSLGPDAQGMIDRANRAGRRGGRGGRARENPLVAELEQLRNALATEKELIIKTYEERLELLDQLHEQQLIKQEEFQEMSRRSKEEYLQALANLDQGYHGSAIDQAGAFFGEMASAMQSGNEKMVRIGRVFGAVEALINAYRAYNQVLADPSLPWFAKIPAALSVLAAGLNTVQSIKSAGSGGGSATGGGSAGGSAAPAAQGRQNVLIDLRNASASQVDNFQVFADTFNEVARQGLIPNVIVRSS